jgi:preprotein translocase subunit YajC
MSEFHTPLFMLGQSGASMPPVGGESSTGGTTTAPGSGAAGGPGAGGGRPSAGIDSFVWIVMLLVLGMIVFTTMAQRRERKKRDALLSSVKKHDRVQTIGGIIGSVVEVKSNTVVLKVDESSNTRMTFARSAIQQVLKEAPDALETERETSSSSK